MYILIDSLDLFMDVVVQNRELFIRMAQHCRTVCKKVAHKFSHNATRENFNAWDFPQVRSTCTRIYIPELFSSSPQWMEDTVHGVHLVLALKHAAVAEFNGGLEPVQTQHQWMAGSHALGTLCKHEPAAQGAAQVLQLAVKG